jgi:hypothetical protein
MFAGNAGAAKNESGQPQGNTNASANADTGVHTDAPAIAGAHTDHQANADTNAHAKADTAASEHTGKGAATDTKAAATHVKAQPVAHVANEANGQPRLATVTALTKNTR